MKKLIFILSLTLAATSMQAQVSVLKEAEKAMKGGKSYTEVLTIVQPAMSNAETANDVQTYYIPGKAGINQYDKLFGARRAGVLPEGQEVTMSNALIGAYENFMKALPLDSLPDAKGKVKPKYSKDIKSQLAGHYNDFAASGVDLYNAEDYKGAYKAWNIFVEMSENPKFYEINPENLQPDTIVMDFITNAGLAVWRDNDNALAAKTFRRAAEKGCVKENVWQYGLATAVQAQSPDDILFFASKGNELFGDHDTQYINNLINYYLKNEKYDDAIKYLDDAIAKKPNSSQYYALEGVIYESKNDMPKAMSLYEKAVELDPENGLANYYYGRGLSIEAGNMSDSFSGNEVDFQNYFNAELLPRYQKAISILEKAYNNDKGNRANTLNMLEQLYYVTNNEEGMNSVKTRKLSDDD